MQIASYPEFIHINQLTIPTRTLRGRHVDVADLERVLKMLGMFLHDPVVRTVPGTRAQFELVVGARRVEAYRSTGISRFQVKVIDIDDPMLLELLVLSENLHRHALPNEPRHIARLKKLVKLLGARGRGGDRRSASFRQGTSNGHGGRAFRSATKEAASMTGRSERSTRRLARIGERAVAAVLTALKRGEITQHEAERVAGLSKEEQVKTLAACRDRRKASRGVTYSLQQCLAGLDHIERRLTVIKSVKADPQLLTKLGEIAHRVVSEIERLSRAGQVDHSVEGEGGATWH